MKIKDVELNIVCGYTSALPQTEEILMILPAPFCRNCGMASLQV